MELTQIEKLEILLDNNKTKYQSGETIKGTVIIKLSRSGKNVRELDLSTVTIMLQAMAEVKWTANPASVHYKEGHIHYDNHKHMDIVYDIPNKISKIRSGSGEHKIPFEFELPDKIPSSIETQHGFINYWIEVIINDSEWTSEMKRKDRERKDITIESPLSETINISVGGGVEKELGILNLASGKVRIDASLKRKGHLPGETVELNCLVTNASTVAVKPRASLYQTKIFICKGEIWSLEKSLELEVGKIVNASETNEQIISVPIPIDIPLSIKSQLISIKYFIHVTLDIPHAIDLHLNLPIILVNNNALNDLDID